MPVLTCASGPAASRYSSVTGQPAHTISDTENDTGLPDDGIDMADALRGFMKTRLPTFMLPGALIEIERMPLTPNGKIDIRALPDLESSEANDPRRPVAVRSTGHRNRACGGAAMV